MARPIGCDETGRDLFCIRGQKVRPYPLGDDRQASEWIKREWNNAEWLESIRRVWIFAEVHAETCSLSARQVTHLDSKQRRKYGLGSEIQETSSPAKVIRAPLTGRLMRTLIKAGIESLQETPSP